MYVSIRDECTRVHAEVCICACRRVFSQKEVSVVR